MPDTSPEPRHPVRVVARRTGLTPDLLRAWERRYGAVHPTRTEGGQRHYSDADVERLRLLARATEGGRQIGSVAGLSDEELRALVEADDLAAGRGPTPVADAPVLAAFYAEALAAVERFDAEALERALRTAALRLPADDVLDHVFGPLLRAIGDRWHQGRLSPANEHLASAAIRRVLTWMTESPPLGPDAPVVVVGTPRGQHHDLGAMLAATAATGHGWKVRFLGPNLPGEELARAARIAGARAVALSLIHPTDDRLLRTELRALRAALPEEVVVVVGGAGAQAYEDALDEIGAARVGSFAGLRGWLSAQDPRAHGTAA